jgi:nitroreductase
MDFFDVVKNRYSVRAYKKDSVDKDKIDKILKTAQAAPTAVNFQPFKITVIETKGREEELKKIYVREWFSQAPYVLCVSILPDTAWVRRDGRKYADVDAGIVMDHIILAATALGLGTCWIGNFNVDAAKEFLKLEEGMEPLLFTPLGYPADENKHIKRKPLEELVEYK